jgi:hypothetical protein
MYAQKTTTADIPILSAGILSYINTSLPLIDTVVSLSRSTFQYFCSLHPSDIHALSRALAVFSLIFLSHCFIASLIKASLLN